MTHSLFLRLLHPSCFSQLQSQVILNNSPAALAHSDVIRALTSLTVFLHIAFQTANAFLPLEPPFPVAPGAGDVYSSTWIHQCAPTATSALVFTLSPIINNRDPGRFVQDQVPWCPVSLFWKHGDVSAWGRWHSGHDRHRPLRWLQQAASNGTSAERRAQWLRNTFCFRLQTIFSQRVKSLFLAVAVLFLDLVPRALTV